MINKQQNQHLLIRQKKQNNTNFIMKQNKLFDRVIKEARNNNSNNIKLNRLFEMVLQNTNEESNIVTNWAEYFKDIIENTDNVNDDNDNKLTLYSNITDKTLASMYDSIINQCANENTVEYSTLSINKKSVPFAPLNKM